MVYKEQEIDKTHNLPLLTSKCKTFNPEFENYKNEIVFINPFSTQFRYPDGDLQPTKDETEKAVVYAEKILQFVKDKIIEPR